jgi:hypothetical protein
MRNTTTFALPLKFSWRVARAGYQWFKTGNARFLCARDAQRLDWHDPFDRYETTYSPLEERTGLFREFAALDATEAEVLKFANRFGLLQNVDNLTLNSELGALAVHGEPLDFWENEIKRFASAVSLWELIRAGRAAELRAELVKLDLPPGLKNRFHFEDDDPAMAGLSVIQRFIDGGLSTNVQAKFLFQGDSPRLGISLIPRDLRGALWLQFAVAIEELKQFRKCPQCGAPFEQSRAPRTGKRPQAVLCSDRCRVAHYRERTDQARRLESAGLPVKDIARKLETEVHTVKGWVKSSKSRGK